MSQIIVCDGCKEEAPAQYYRNGWKQIQLTVKKGYTSLETDIYMFHICSQHCFNAVMRWVSGDVCQE